MWSAVAAGLAFCLPAVARAEDTVVRRHLERLVIRAGNSSTYALNAAIVPLAITEDKQSYYSVIKAGNLSFRVALDTGSADLWLMSSACSSDACKAVPRYPLEYFTGSFGSLNNNETVFNVSFADGTVANGFIGQENVQLGNLSVSNQTFGVVSDSNVTLVDQVSGILGLGFSRLSTIAGRVSNATPFFASLAHEGLLTYPLFGLSLTRNSSGTLTFGAVDSSIVTNVSNVQWTAVVPFSPFGAEANTSSYLQWVTPLTGVAMNGSGFATQPTYPDVSDKSLALLDVGTAGIYGPYQDVSKLFSLMSGSRLVDLGGQWAVPCDINEPMAFTIGLQNYTLQPTDYLIGPVSGSPDLCLTWPRALPPSTDGIDWQLGSAFLRTVYSVFSFGIDDQEPPMIGLYALNATNSTSASPDALSSFFASASATVATTLPNFPLSTPTYTTPAYALNTSVPASAGETVASGLAVSTYSALLGGKHANVSALPTVSPPATLVTFILTSAGVTTTSTSTVASATVTLGLPGFNGASRRAPVTMTAVSVVAALVSGMGLVML